jgi:hypothetical protein
MPNKLTALTLEINYGPSYRAVRKASHSRMLADYAYAARLLQEVAGRPMAERQAFAWGLAIGVNSQTVKACVLTAWGF